MQNTRPPLSRIRFLELLSITPPERALSALMKEVPHVPRPGHRLNRTQTMLNLVYAVDGSIGGGQGIALFIDYDTGEEFDLIIDILHEVGAHATASYLIEGRSILGGRVPSDELERAKLTERFDRELLELDRQNKHLPREEAAKCFLAWLLENENLTLRDLNETREKKE